MPKTFICFLHKAGAMAPDLRVVTCQSKRDLPRAIGAELRLWGEVDKVEVYDDADQPVFIFSRGVGAES